MGIDFANATSETIEAHFGEFQIQKRLQEIDEEITAQGQFKNDNEKRIKQNDKEIAKLS